MFNQKPKNTQVLFLDMNAFFASVEQQIQPTLRGQPIGVAPYTGDSGCIISQSYEAKKRGLKAGLRVGEAKKACPGLKILEARPAIYSFYHKEIVKLVYTFSPFVTVASIDEMYVTLSPSEQLSSIVAKLAEKIKQAIKEKVGDYLKCSIGIGPNRFLAKQAAEFKKPDGYFEILLEDLPAYYKEINLRDLKGINFQMEKWCQKIGIDSPLKFYLTSLFDLKKRWGHLGVIWYYKLHGYEISETTSPTRTVGHSCVLPPEARTRKVARKVLAKLVEKVAYRLRKDNLWARGVFVSIYFLNKHYFAKKITCPPSADNYSLQKYALDLFDQCQISTPILKLAVTAYNLVYTKEIQLPLLGGPRKNFEISRALDFLNDKYGAETIHSANCTRTGVYAPDRIPFGRPRYEIRH